MKYYDELKKRNVFRVAAAYLVVAWGTMQFANLMMGLLELPSWTGGLVLTVLVIGFVPAIIAAWALELTPDGLKRESEVDRDSIGRKTQRHKLDYVIVVMLVLVISGMAVERAFFVEPGAIEPVTTSARIRSETPAAPDRSVAVLPFADLSQEQDQQWFADGLADEILNALARTPEIRASSRTSSLAYRGTDKDARTIARELGVAHVLEGSIRRSDGRIRITAQLIRGEDDVHVWSQTYDAADDDAIAVQEDVAEQIVVALQTAMDADALESMTQVGTRSVRAYQAYMLGHELELRAMRTGDAGLVTAAYEQFEEARQIDPQFAVAHRAAADYWKIRLNPTRGSATAGDLPATAVLQNFVERIELAVETATDEADRSASRAQRATVQLRLRNAIRRFDEYLDSRPGDFKAWFDLLLVAEMAGDRDAMDEALDVLRAAGDRDRFAATNYVGAAYRSRSPSSVADAGLSWLKRWPNDAGLTYQTHRALLWAGRIEDAAELYERMPPALAQNLLLRARQACAEGRRDDATEILHVLRSAEVRAVATEWMLLMLLGREDEAVGLLREYEAGGIPYQLASWLVLNTFDPTPYPSLVQMLNRENVQRPQVTVLPFACPAE